MTNWFLYRIEHNTLEALFNIGFNSVVAMQSIAEPDLKDFRDINAVTRVQICMLRRFVGCLNCKQHPPIYPGAEGSGALLSEVLLGAGGGSKLSSATSTAPSTAVLHDLNTNIPEAQSHGREFAPGAGPSTGTCRPCVKTALQRNLQFKFKNETLQILCKIHHAIHEAIVLILYILIKYDNGFKYVRRLAKDDRVTLLMFFLNGFLSI